MSFQLSGHHRLACAPCLRLGDPVAARREEVNMVLEAARQQGFLGASLEARVLLHVGDPALAAQLAALQQVRSSHAPGAAQLMRPEQNVHTWLVGNAAACSRRMRLAAPQASPVGALYRWCRVVHAAGAAA